MSARTPSELGGPRLVPGNGCEVRPWERNIVRLASRRLHSSIAHISAFGDIDASNAPKVTEYALHHAASCQGLVLDLRGLSFFAAEGFSALHRIAVNCARRGSSWAIVPGVAACRVLGICDPESSLPQAETLAAAVAMFTNPLGCITTARATADGTTTYM